METVEALAAAVDSAEDGVGPAPDPGPGPGTGKGDPPAGAGAVAADATARDPVIGTRASVEAEGAGLRPEAGAGPDHGTP